MMLNFVITAGGTVEPIDHVREIRNSSTGATGVAMAEALKKTLRSRWYLIPSSLCSGQIRPAS